MDRAFYEACVNKEVYGLSGKSRFSLIDKIRWKYFSVQGNSVYLVRKAQYYFGKGKLGWLYAYYLRTKLVRRYGIFLNMGATIDIGLRIPHPTSIVLTNATIGKNFTIYQGCTIGQKGDGQWNAPRIGDNVTMFANSSVVGGVNVGDNVVIAAHACVVKDAEEAGVYVGCPAVHKKKQ